MLIAVDAGRGPLVALVCAGAGARDDTDLRAHVRTLPAPHPAFAMSRSYCFPYALVGWHSEPIGVDIERIVTCDEKFGRSICTPQELAEAPWGSAEEIVSLWSSKEALAKALGDALRYDPRRLQSPRAWPDGASGPWRARMLPAPFGYCAWVCWRRSQELSPPVV
jgi:4'-phosphopantetheinyl transferase superfamily protein